MQKYLEIPFSFRIFVVLNNNNKTKTTMATLIEIIQTLGINGKTIEQAIKKAEQNRWEEVTLEFNHCHDGYGSKKIYEGKPSKYASYFIRIHTATKKVVEFTLITKNKIQNTLGDNTSLKLMGKPSLFWEEYYVEGLGYFYQKPHENYNIMFSTERKTFKDELNHFLIRPLLLEIVNNWGRVETQLIEYEGNTIIKMVYGDYILTYTSSEGAICTHGDLYETCWTTSQAGFTLRRKGDNIVLNASITSEGISWGEGDERMRKLRNGEVSLQQFVYNLAHAGLSYESNNWFYIL